MLKFMRKKMFLINLVVFVISAVVAKDATLANRKE